MRAHTKALAVSIPADTDQAAATAAAGIAAAAATAAAANTAAVVAVAGGGEAEHDGGRAVLDDGQALGGAPAGDIGMQDGQRVALAEEPGEAGLLVPQCQLDAVRLRLVDQHDRHRLPVRGRVHLRPGGRRQR